MTRQEAVNWLINVTSDIGKAEYRNLWHYEQALCEIKEMLEQSTIEPVANSDKYEYHYDHTDCIWYRPEARNRCPSTCAQYRDGWNDAMNYIFCDGKGYRPYRRDKQYEERKEGADGCG